MTGRPDFLLGRIGVEFSCSGVQRTCPIVSIGPKGRDYGRPVRRASRQAPGARPVAFLNARLKAASESYPTSAPIVATLALLWDRWLAATCIRHWVRYCIGGWPTSSAKRLARLDREDAVS